MSVSVLYTFYFAYSMLSVIDVNVRSFHWILLNIQVDRGIVDVIDSLNKDPKNYSDIKELLQR